MRLQQAVAREEVRQPRSDTNIQLAMNLERSLRREVMADIRVHVSGDHLQLFGIVPTWHLKQKVQEVVRKAACEYRIQNDLRVQSCS